MCAILDANQVGDFLKEKENFNSLWNWVLKKKGKFIYGGTTFNAEYGKLFNLFKDLRQRNILKRIDEEEVNKEEEKLLKNVELKSNDAHIIALAKVADVKLLVSKDKKLRTDFEAIIGGNIYQDNSHEHLLTADICP